MNRYLFFILFHLSDFILSKNSGYKISYFFSSSLRSKYNGIFLVRVRDNQEVASTMAFVGSEAQKEWVR